MKRKKRTTVTRHGNIRGRERIGLNKWHFKHLVEKASIHGIAHNETTGSLNRYIAKLYFYNRKANNIRLYQGQVFIFHQKTLITVFPLPKKYIKCVKELEDKNKKK